MNYLPFEKITYKSNLSSDEILKRLTEITEPDKPFSTTEILKKFRFREDIEPTSLKTYEGFINGKSFNISRKLDEYTHNSFLPVIIGNIEADSDKTKINLKMRFNSGSILFIILWFGGIGTFGMEAMSSSKKFELINIVPFGVLIVSYIALTGVFNYENLKSKKYFVDLFEAKIE